MTEEDKPRHVPPDDRLPPPAFPPGSRRRRPMLGHPGAVQHLAAMRRDTEEGTGLGPRAARSIFSPQAEAESEVGAESFPEGAYITPEEAAEKMESRQAETGVATGIGVRRSSFAPVPVPEAEEIDFHQAAAVLERLAHGLRKNGGLALLVGPDLSRFEAVLRGFLAGYLGGMETDRE